MERITRGESGESKKEVMRTNRKAAGTVRGETMAAWTRVIVSQVEKSR